VFLIFKKDSKMKKTCRVMVISLAIWFGLTAGTANALSPGPLEFVDNGTSFDANFGNDSVLSAFEDHFTFTPSTDMAGSGGSSIVSGFGSGGFNTLFSSFILNDLTVGTTVATGKIPSGFVGTLDFVAPLAAGHEYDFVVTGAPATVTSSGSYSGNVSISPVPEVETYAMLLVGLGLLGLAARRRKYNF
jgi:hypothetical protein